jgi:hypothetical protein
MTTGEGPDVSFAWGNTGVSGPGACIAGVSTIGDADGMETGAVEVDVLLPSTTVGKDDAGTGIAEVGALFPSMTTGESGWGVPMITGVTDSACGAGASAADAEEEDSEVGGAIH